ncbi:MAG: diguanylate cyclase [Terriglobia bacterium]
MLEEISIRLQKNNQRILAEWLEILKGTLNLEVEEIFPTEDFLDIVVSLLDGVALVVKDREELAAFEEGGAIYSKARELGELRQSQGFKIDQVVREYLLLKDALWGFCHSEFPMESVDIRELGSRLNQSLDRILVTTIETYVEYYSKTLQALAITDPLTRVKNQSFFLEQLKLEVTKSKRYKHPVSLLLIDVDYFRAYNESYGHLQGDEILKIYATVFKDNCRGSDVVARFGGDDFGLILPSTDKAKAEQLGMRLKHEVEKLRITPVIGQKPRKMTISIGAATAPEDAQTAEGLIDSADEALFRAKRAGGNSLVTARATRG